MNRKQPDAELCVEVEAWLSKAKNDLASAKVLMSASPPILDTCVFHCQQAVEKSLKALLTRHQKVFSKTHNIEALGRR